MTHAMVHPISFLAVLLAGLIGGLLFGTAVEQQRLTALDASSWTVARHSIDAVFGRVLPYLWNATLLLLFAAACLNRGGSRWMFAAAALLLLLGIVVTLIVEVPINKQIAVWTPTSVPANWAELRARWLKFHHVRTVSGMAAFLCALLGGMGW